MAHNIDSSNGRDNIAYAVNRETEMQREQAITYVSFGVDDALSERLPSEAPPTARLIGWQCGFEPLFVAVWSYLGVELDDDEAEELARDLLQEKRWFTDNDNPPSADYIL